MLGSSGLITRLAFLVLLCNQTEVRDGYLEKRRLHQLSCSADSLTLASALPNSPAEVIRSATLDPDLTSLAGMQSTYSSGKRGHAGQADV